MDQELKDRWLAALRSGEYKQARKRLRDDDNCFCCLGVLCDIVDRNRWKKDEAFDRMLYHAEDDRYYSFIPPDYILDRLNLNNVWKVGYLLHREIAKMNDDGASFSEIADWIEENVK